MTARTRFFDLQAIGRLALATVVLAAAIAVVQRTPDAGGWLLARWIAGGIAILSIAEMVSACQDCISALIGLTAPALFQSPHRSTSLSEFWAQRWNPLASELFRKTSFLPFARRSVFLALFITFAVSAICHGLLTMFALGQVRIAIVCAVFFLVQPFFIWAERQLKVRSWKPLAGRAWTFTMLAITSPLVAEPVLRIAEQSWPASHNVLLPTAVALGVVVVVTGAASVASLLALTRPDVSFAPVSD